VLETAWVAAGGRGQQRRKTAAVSLLAVFGLLASGCGGDDSGSNGGALGSDPRAKTAETIAGTATPATGTPVKLGFFNAEGGSTVSLPEARESAEATVKYANDYLGGIKGHKIELDICNDKSDAATATACANQFVEDGVVAVVGGQPASSDQLIPTIKSAGIPYFGFGANGTQESIGGEGLYFASPGFVGILSAWAQHAKEKGYKKFAVFLVDNPQATGGVMVVGRPLFEKNSIELQINAIPQGTPDATSQVQAGLANDPDAIAVVGDGTICQAVLSGLEAAGSDKPRLIIAPCLAAQVRDAVPEALEGSTIFDVGDRTSDDPEATLYRAVMGRYAPDTDPSGNANVGYLSMLSFVRSVNAGATSDALDKASVMAALKAAKGVPRPLGQGQTLSCDQNALAGSLVTSTICNATVFSSTVKDGEEGNDIKQIDTSALFK
jgi:branched-chain amino acid transport system substrate-binding protein